MVLTLISCISDSVASSVEQLQKHNLDDQAQSKNAQQQINVLDDQKLDLIEQVKSLQAQAENLETYNHYLDKLLTDQEYEKNVIKEQIDSVVVTRRGVVPLMVSMLENLQQFVDLDAPLLIAERQQRLTQLQNMMKKANVSDAEKFRRLLESYQIEAEYGSKMGEYQGSLSIDGIERTVNYFYLGRVVFVAISLDAKNVWVWERKNNQWLEADVSYAAEIEKGIRIAKKNDIPALLELPLLSEVNE